MLHRLIIDDDRYFESLGDDGVTYARTVKEAAHFLKLGPYDEIWLDHDLGLGGDINPIIVMLEELAYAEQHPTEHIIIHTMNPTGRHRMHMALAPHYKVTHILPEQYGCRRLY